MIAETEEIYRTKFGRGGLTLIEVTEPEALTIEGV